WTQIAGYFARLAAASDRVLVEDVGKTTEGRPFLVVTISSPANLARREEIRRANLRLADPRGLSSDEAERLIQGGKTIVALNHGIHSTEVGPPQASMATAYWLASSDEPDVREILDRCVILMLPSHNPDGTQKVVEWYRKSLGTAWEGREIPFLYHRYTGHDNNRDWYAFTQVESRLTLEHLYDRWRPQIVHDLHQMGEKGARIFVPPYTDPYEPNVDPATIAAISGLGAHMAARLLGEGKTGVVVGALFDGYSPARAYPHTHGGVRILSELASAHMATPIDVPWTDLESGGRFDARKAAWNFPAPWPGGRWTLGDVVSYELTATRALLEHAARNREFWLRNFEGVLRRAAARTDLYAFVLPGDTKDAFALSRLVQILRLGAVEVHRARGPFQADGRSYPAGSYIVKMQQPFSSFAKQVLERQQYPDLRLTPGGTPVRPYDVTAHTLPLLMGVPATAVVQPFSADLEPVGEAFPTARSTSGKGRFLALGHKTGELVALGRLLRAGAAVRWATEAFDDHGRSFEAGTLLVPAASRGALAPLTGELGIMAQAVDANPRALALRSPRVGLYQSWVASMDEGWTRFVFDKQMGVTYETLHDADVLKGALKSRFDAIVLPDQTPAEILNGHLPGTLPDEYTGGLGKAGAARLKEFVEEGGTLVALDTASLFATSELGLAVKVVSAPSAFYCPGALLNTRVEGGSPLAHGLDPETAVWFESSPVFEAAPGAAVLRYPAANPLASGWLIGEAHLQGQAALVEASLGRGRVVLFGFRPQYRGQSWATYIPLLNALYTSAATPAAR
ncbi:MAG TPA: M14 metallopeptidase family protein, partial [Vicinamibacteria bacterium]|nr:M14 metallopeptidase family protein [Vicinamibacteria bacterium]